MMEQKTSISSSMELSSRTLRRRFLSALLLTCSLCASGQTLTGQSADGTQIVLDSTLVANADKNVPTKWIPVISDEDQPLMMFQGFTVSADLFGAGQYLFSSYGTIEGALRLNLKNTYFPIAELGYAICDKTEELTDVRYYTKAPYMRIGFDYNLLKNKRQDNRLFVGCRWGFSTYNFDIQGPSMTDPIWGGEEAFSQKGISCTSHWLEVGIGCQVKLWSIVHLGWSVRYKSELSSSKNDYARPYYIPGYGTTTTGSCWGGTYNLIFDLNWGKKTSKVRTE